MEDLARTLKAEVGEAEGAAAEQALKEALAARSEKIRLLLKFPIYPNAMARSEKAPRFRVFTPRA